VDSISNEGAVSNPSHAKYFLIPGAVEEYASRGSAAPPFAVQRVGHQDMLRVEAYNKAQSEKVVSMAGQKSRAAFR
jgi:hypothetical protein